MFHSFIIKALYRQYLRCVCVLHVSVEAINLCSFCLFQMISPVLQLDSFINQMMANVWAHCVHFHLHVAFYVFKAYRGKRNEDWVCEDISFYDSMNSSLTKKFI